MAEPEVKVEFRLNEDFASLYANNVQFEPSAWDLKMMFGQLDQARNFVEQHTAVTLSWPHAKVTAYYLAANLFIHQRRNGFINLSPAVIPTRPDPTDPALDEQGRRNIAYLAWIHDQFFSEDPYTPPELQALDQQDSGTAPGENPDDFRQRHRTSVQAEP